jgi:hypothetical protein
MTVEAESAVNVKQLLSYLKKLFREIYQIYIIIEKQEKLSYIVIQNIQLNSASRKNLTSRRNQHQEKLTSRKNSTSRRKLSRRNQLSRRSLISV